MFSVVQAYVASALCVCEGEKKQCVCGGEFYIHSQLEMMILPLAPSLLSSLIFQRGKQQRRKNKKRKNTRARFYPPQSSRPFEPASDT